MWHLFLGATLALGLGAGSDPGPDAGWDAPPRAQDECFEIVLGAWAPPPPPTPDSLVLALPGRIRLTEERVGEWPPRGSQPEHPLAPARDGWTAPRLLRAAEGALDSVHEERTWQEGPDGTLLLRFVTRGSGVLLRVDREGEGGRAAAMWDVPLPVHRASAALRAVECDAPLPEEARFRWDFSVEVPLEAPGVEGPVDLGAALPPGIDSPRGAGFLEGATEIELERGDDGRLERVTAVFPEATSHEELLARLQEAWGPPSVSYGTTFRWIGRSLRYTMFAPSPVGWTVEMEVRVTGATGRSGADASR